MFLIPPIHRRKLTAKPLDIFLQVLSASSPVSPAYHHKLHMYDVTQPEALSDRKYAGSDTGSRVGDVFGGPDGLDGECGAQAH